MDYKKHLAIGLSTTFILVIVTGCAEDPRTYENEQIVFENIAKTDAVAAKGDDEANDELSLKEEESSNFGFARPLFGYGAAYGYAPYPVFEYYRQPLAVHIPVAPFASVVDFVHPFYVAPYLDRLVDDFYGDDDDDGRW